PGGEAGHGLVVRRFHGPGRCLPAAFRKGGDDESRLGGDAASGRGDSEQGALVNTATAIRRLRDLKAPVISTSDAAALFDQRPATRLWTCPVTSRSDCHTASNARPSRRRSSISRISLPYGPGSSPPFPRSSCLAASAGHGSRIG